MRPHSFNTTRELYANAIWNILHRLLIIINLVITYTMHSYRTFWIELTILFQDKIEEREVKQ